MPLLTLRTPSRRETRVLGSRFIACAFPVTGEDAARARRVALREEFPDATHHCWALRLRMAQGEGEIHENAGEPAGTAGPPLLQALRRAGVTNSLVVVVRYFGGTKLGKGGLARAYREAARAALEAAGVLETPVALRIRLQGPLSADGEVRHLVARHGGRLLEASYGDGDAATLTIEVPEGSVARLRSDLARLTRGSWTGTGGT